jgi:MFS transporter, AAHS family, 4-hydroxybenzoate transporter
MNVEGTGMEPRNFRELLDERPVSRLQIMVLILSILVAVMDGFDTQAIGYVAPAIVESWGVTKQALGPVFSAGLIGSLFGALIFGLLADRFGRRPMLILCTTIFGCAALASATASTVPTLIALRLITGLGLGGAMPIALAHVSEFMPARVRNIAVTLTYVGFSLGAALGGFAADQVVRHLSWSAVFVAGGVPTLVLMLCIAAVLPESVGFLIRRSDAQSRLLAILKKLGIEESTFHTTTEQRRPYALIGTVGLLFGDGRALLTAAIWLIIFLNLMQLYFFTSWLPIMIHGAAIGIGSAALITALFQVGGSVGALVIGVLIGRFQKFVILGSVYLGGVLFIASVGVILDSIHGPLVFAGLAVAVTLAGVSVVGGQIGAIAATATIYPEAIRTTGVGWALGIGRVGSVVGPFIGSTLIANQLSARELFAMGAVPALIAGVTALTITFLGLEPRVRLRLA